MTETTLPRRTPSELTAMATAPIDRGTLDIARRSIERVRENGERALEEMTAEFAERPRGMPLYLGPEELAAGLSALDPAERTRLERIAGRIARFARAQRASLLDIDVAVDGGRAGHVVSPVRAAGCYAPGGRYPLPSSVLMTAVTARAAGVPSVWVASPRPSEITVAAAAVAGADGLLVAGGAHAIAALATGVGPIPRCNVIVGPGNRYVTAAKQLLFGHVQIDMLAGPSELVVLADDTADPVIVAADLLAQAEHDPEALPVLVTTSASLADRVVVELERQLATLPTGDTARSALARGGVAVVRDLGEAYGLCNALAPEHLEIMVESVAAAHAAIDNYGAVCLGPSSAVVFGDYGVGPNHVLPTGGTAHAFGGLSALTFLRTRTWLDLEGASDQRELLDDVTWLARAEGLEGHARAAETRVAGLAAPAP